MNCASLSMNFRISHEHAILSTFALSLVTHLNCFRTAVYLTQEHLKFLLIKVSRVRKNVDDALAASRDSENLRYWKKCNLIQLRSPNRRFCNTIVKE